MFWCHLAHNTTRNGATGRRHRCRGSFANMMCVSGWTNPLMGRTSTESMAQPQSTNSPSIRSCKMVPTVPKTNMKPFLSRASVFVLPSHGVCQGKHPGDLRFGVRKPWGTLSWPGLGIPELSMGHAHPIYYVFSTIYYVVLLGWISRCMWHCRSNTLYRLEHFGCHWLHHVSLLALLNGLTACGRHCSLLYYS